jgi:pyruvate/2-oxoglutarate dehydrogenase complex dihydrolipoamide acyltransferase (E2) component
MRGAAARPTLLLFDMRILTLASAAMSVSLLWAVAGAAPSAQTAPADGAPEAPAPPRIAPPPPVAPAPQRAGAAGVADPFAPAPAGAHPPLTDALIHQAIHDTLEEADRQAAAERQAVANKQMQPGVAPGGVVYRGRADADILSSAFDEAKVPDCLHPDGLKNQPTFFLAGLLALPFVAVAKLRGKCN